MGYFVGIGAAILLMILIAIGVVAPYHDRDIDEPRVEEVQEQKTETINEPGDPDEVCE